MNHRGVAGRQRRSLRTARDLMLAGALACSPVAAGENAGPHLGSVVIDAGTGAVLHADRANRRVRPASLTKLMTVWLLLDALERGEAVAEDRWPVSSRAAGQPATRLGLRRGDGLSVDVALDALLIASANDVAVVAAEAMAGSESAFVARMNEAAAALDMTRTRFGNPSGLPGPQHHTTARDMALLARALWQRFPRRRERFARTGMTYAGRWIGSHNRLLVSYRGARGMKTGFTCRAGFHLVASARRDGRTLIGVVLGAPDREVRGRLMRRLLDRAFAAGSDTGWDLGSLADAPDSGAGSPVHSGIVARTCLEAKGPAGPSGWSIDVGIRRTEKDARALAREFIRERRRALPGARPWTIPRFTGVELKRAIVTGLTKEHARDACLAFREQGGDCIIFGPQAAAAQMEQVARVRALEAGRVPRSAARPAP